MSSLRSRIAPEEYQRLSEVAATEMSDGQADILTMRLFFRLLRFGNRLNKDFETAIRSKANLSFPGYQLLFSLKAVGPLGSNELARLAAVSTASMTSLLHTLERKGYVLREDDPDDARKKIISLTAAGQELVAELHIESMDREVAWSQALTKEEGEQLDELISKLLAHQPWGNGDGDVPKTPWKQD